MLAGFKEGGEDRETGGELREGRSRGSAGQRGRGTIHCRALGITLGSELQPAVAETSGPLEWTEGDRA